MKKYLAIALVLGLVIAVTGAVAVSHAATPASQASTVEKVITPDTDNIQSGDQTTPDATTAPSTSAGDEATATSETAGESNAEEPGDQNLPGGGHQDAAGQNVDHQFNGVE